MTLKLLSRFLCNQFSRRSIPRNGSCGLLSTQPEPASGETETNSSSKATSEGYVNPLRKPDFFNVRDLVNIRDLFDARVHFGHREDTLHPNMRSYIFGSRLGYLIFDLEQTASLLRDALNFAAHIAYRDGVILFVSRYYQHCPIIEQTALDCGEFALTRTFKNGLFTDSEKRFGTAVRLPDLLIFTCTLGDILTTHIGVIEAAKMNIPTIGVVDTNSDPTIITYPVPGNDDSAAAVELYCRLFKTAILKGKEARKKDLETYLPGD